MGRRSINTTKSGKYMNPTDQARKEARKKELKKNKRQRMAVRAAVLKGKDPMQLINEMEKMDQMEFNVEIPPALSEKVLKDKRKKLRETLERVLKLYEKENPEYWVEIRRKIAEYEKKRLTIIEYYEAVKHAQAVTVDEIPLPNLDMPPMPAADSLVHSYNGMDVTVPPFPHEGTAFGASLLAMHPPPPPGILKKQAPVMPSVEPIIIDHKQYSKTPPGCPPTLPPELSDEEDTITTRTKRIRFRDEQDAQHSDDEKEAIGDKRDDKNYDSDDEDGKSNKEKASHRGLTSLQAKLLKLSGQDVDQFVKESEVLMQEREAGKKAELKERLSRIKNEPRRRSLDQSGKLTTGDTAPHSATFTVPPNVDGDASSHQINPAIAPIPTPYGIIPPLGMPPGAPPGMPSGMHNIPPMFRPPPPRPGMPPPPMGVRLPPGPPPQNLSQLLPQGPPRLPNMRLPPPMRPPGGVPPPGMLPLALPPVSVMSMPNSASNVLSAAPQLVSRPSNAASGSTATIQAKPQIRNLSADVTRFQPTVLRIKREDKKKSSKFLSDAKDSAIRPEEFKKPTKDDAYSQFMREMEDLM